MIKQAHYNIRSTLYEKVKKKYYDPQIKQTFTSSTFSIKKNPKKQMIR